MAKRHSVVSESEDGCKRLENPIYHQRPLRVICVGAGASGLCLAYKLQRSFNNYTLKLYEKNEGVGGTWLENSYPGCVCDYPAHNYTYSFEPKFDWKEVYESAAAIRQYFEDFVRKYELESYCYFKHQVTRASWNEHEWCVQIRDLTTNRVSNDFCDILINASGVLNQWQWPNILGLDSFRGELVHSARWKEDLHLEGKNVGLIGNGSSGQQIVEAIQSFVGRLTIFVRQPNWIFGPFGPEPRAYTKEEIEEFEQKPDVLLQLRKQNEVRINSYFESCIKDSEAQTGIRNYLTQSMREKLQNSELEDLFIPKWAVGCRRPTPGHRYLECLTSDNVSVVHGSIDQIIPSGCISNGIEHDLEVLICATGFDTSYRPRFPLIGFDGVDLQQEWENDPKAYMAIAAPYMPNYFIFYGPNNPFASGPFLASIEAQADYMLKWCDRWQTENIQSFAPKAIAVDELQAHTKEILRTTVWADTCRSWYKAHETDSKNMKMWPGSGLHYIEAISEIRADDWDVTYVGNRFAWLGNGFSRTEVDPTSDRSYYIRNHDDGLYLSREKRRKLLTEKREKREILDF